MSNSGKYHRTLGWRKKRSEYNKKIGLRPPSRKGIKHTNEWKQIMSKRNSGKNNPFYGKTHTMEAKKRISETPRTDKQLKQITQLGKSRRGKKYSDESRKNQSRRMKNVKNNFWIDGRSAKNENIRKNLEYRLWRETVFKRDDWTCVWCKQKGGELNADHIKPFSLFPELRFDINNGRTLCHNCHKKTSTYGNKVRNYKKTLLMVVENRGELPFEYAKFITNLAWHRIVDGVKFYEGPRRSIWWTRNKMIEEAMTTDFTHFLFLDTDVIPQNMLFLHKLKEHDKDLVSGFYCDSSGRPVNRKNGTPFWGKNLMEVDVFSMGYSLIKKTVFEKVPYPVAEPPEKLDADIEFCGDAKKAGYKIYTDFNLRGIHLLEAPF
ncbi:HNH endonuclease [Candidatus Microgenomates bacterium]|nr:HNH endonuclease [Candidatus Microgenomates bacterium]